MSLMTFNTILIVKKEERWVSKFWFCLIHSKHIVYAVPWHLVRMLRDVTILVLDISLPMELSKTSKKYTLPYHLFWTNMWFNYCLPSSFDYSIFRQTLPVRIKTYLFEIQYESSRIFLNRFFSLGSPIHVESIWWYRVNGII